jgi:hypothetical protein
MKAVLIHTPHVVRAWIDLGPILKAAEQETETREAVMEGTAQLWAVLDHYEPIGAIVTRVDTEAGRCLIWKIAGERVREWAEMFVATVAAWARSLGCTAVYGIGRKGWTRIVEPMGFRRVEDVNGKPAWELAIGGPHG